MHKIVVQVYEIRENGQGLREEARVENIDKWTLTYEEDITIAQLAYRIEENFPRYYPNLPPLAIKYLKDAPSGSYDGGILNEDDYACNVFGKQDMVRVYRAQPISSTSKSASVRFGSVAPNSCAARPSKRIRDGDSFYRSRVLDPLSPQIKRRRMNMDEPVSALQTEHEPMLGMGGNVNRLEDEPVIVMDSQRSPGLNTNMYSTPKSHSAQDSVSKNFLTSLRDVPSSQVRRNGQGALGERPVSNASTPKSESPDPDGNLVYSIPASAGGTPVTTGKPRDRFVRPSLPKNSRWPRQDGPDEITVTSIEKDSEHNLPAIPLQRDTPEKIIKPQRISSAKALSRKSLEGSRSIFEGPYDPDDIEESSQTALRRCDVSSKDYHYSPPSNFSGSRSTRENYMDACEIREYESGPVLKVPQTTGSTVSAPHAQARVRHKTSDPKQDHTKMTNTSNGLRHSQRISRVKKRRLVSDQEDFTSFQDVSLEQGLDVESEVKRRRHGRNLNKKTNEEQTQTAEHNLQESLQQEADSIGLKSMGRRTSEFSTAPIPLNSSSRRKSLTQNSVTSNQTPSILPSDTQSISEKRSVSILSKDATTDNHSSSKTPLAKKDGQLDTQETSTRVTMKTSFKKSSTPSFSRANFFEAFFDNFDKVVVPKQFVDLKKGNHSALASVKKETLSPKSTTPDLRQGAVPLSKPVGGKASTIPAKRTPIHDYENSGDESSIISSNENQECPERTRKIGSNHPRDSEESPYRNSAGRDVQEAQDENKADKSNESDAASGIITSANSGNEERDTIESCTTTRDGTKGDSKKNIPNKTRYHGLERSSRQNSVKRSKISARNRNVAPGMKSRLHQSRTSSLDVTDDHVLPLPLEEKQNDGQAYSISHGSELAPKVSKAVTNSHLSTDQDSSEEETFTDTPSNVNGSLLPNKNQDSAEVCSEAAHDGADKDFNIEKTEASSKSTSVAESRSPARKVESSEDESDSESGTENKRPAQQTFVPTRNKLDPTATTSPSSKLTKKGLNEDSSKKVMSAASALQSKDGLDESEVSEESSGLEGEPSLPILERKSKRTRTQSSSYGASLMDDAERQIQREATQSIDKVNSIQSNENVGFAAVGAMKDSSARKITKLISAPKPASNEPVSLKPLKPSKSIFPSFTDLKSHGNLYNHKNPPFKSPITMPTRITNFDDDSDDDSTDSDSDESDDDHDTSVSAGNKKIAVSSRGKGRYHSLIKSVREQWK